METGETKSISRIKSLLGEIPPRLDVAGDEQARNIDAAYATANAIRVENSLSKELLAASSFDIGSGFGWSGRCDQITASL